MAGPLSITNFEADATGSSPTLVVTFSEPVDVPSATNLTNYAVTVLPAGGAYSLSSLALALNGTTAVITLGVTGPALNAGDWIQVVVNHITPRGGGTPIASPNNVFVTQVHATDVGVAAGDIALNTGSIAANTGSTSQAVEDIASFSVLTEEIGYPPSPLARPSWGGAMAPAAGGTLGQTAMKAISDVLGWQAKPDPKGFIGALNASFALKEIEGHTEATWTPRTYAIQTDLSGGITGAQASVYQRAKDALDKSLPLLDGLYPLFKEAKDEEVAALKATIRSQFTDLVNELGLYGGPRISRISQFFLLLLGQPLPQSASLVPAFLRGAPLPPPLQGPLQTDPDQISGSLGNLRSDCGFGQADDQVNTVEDEQDVTNFRIVTDYVTSLAQSWLNNLQFFGLQTATPFFGTQLVLLSRQLSVITESVNEVRFTLDSVFIGPAERQTLEIQFPSGDPPMFIEDLLTWVETFASQEGPRLIQEGGKSGVGQSFTPIGEQLQILVAGAENPTNISSLPRGYRTKRVQRSLEELADQLQELVNLALPIHHIITPEPEPALALLGINPNAIFLSAWPSPQGRLVNIQITIIGTGFDVKAAGTIQDISPTQELNFGPGVGSLAPVTIHSDNLASATLLPTSSSGGLPPARSYTLQITMPNRDPNLADVTLVTSLTILP
jgi:hypothetical protein